MSETTGNREAVVAIYPSREAAQAAVAHLTTAGFAASDIAVIAAESSQVEPAPNAASEHTRSTVRGALIGTALGVLLSVEAVFLGQGSPGLEIGTVEEATQYGVSSAALSGPDPDAPGALYREELQHGRVVVVAHADHAAAEAAAEALTGTDPLDLRIHPFDFDPAVGV